uniref:Transcriptional regulator, HxlR family n=1 Tax=Parastrongyloides trichosuri TaxID=131310 RepID=A0A0N5A0U9_PARTI
ARSHARSSPGGSSGRRSSSAARTPPSARPVQAFPSGRSSGAPLPGCAPRRWCRGPLVSVANSRSGSRPTGRRRTGPDSRPDAARRRARSALGQAPGRSPGRPVRRRGHRGFPRSSAVRSPAPCCAPADGPHHPDRRTGACGRACATAPRRRRRSGRAPAPWARTGSAGRWRWPPSDPDRSRP